VTLRSDTAIIETLKWAEDGEAFIVRLYDAGKTGSKVRLEFGLPLKSVTETNILEEDVEPVRLSGGSAQSVEVYLRPFEIKTLRCEL